MPKRMYIFETEDFVALEADIWQRWFWVHGVLEIEDGVVDFSWGMSMN